MPRRAAHPGTGCPGARVGGILGCRADGRVVPATVPLQVARHAEPERPGFPGWLIGLRGDTSR